MALTIRETAFDDEARADFWNLPTAKFVGEQARYEEAAKTGVLKVLAAETEDGERAGTFFGLVVPGEQLGKDGDVFWVLGAVSRVADSVLRMYRAVHSSFAKEMVSMGCKWVRGAAPRAGVQRMLKEEGFIEAEVVFYKEFMEEDLEDRE